MEAWGVRREVWGEQEVVIAFELRWPHSVSGVNLISKTRFNGTSLSVSLKLFNYKWTLKYTANFFLLCSINTA